MVSEGVLTQVGSCPPGCARVSRQASLLKHFRRQREWTRALIAALPEELFDWQPEGSGFSCGGLVRHLIQAEIFWRKLLQSAVAGREYDPFGIRGDLATRLESFRPVNVGASRDDRLGSSFQECLDSWLSVQEGTERFLERLPEDALLRVRAKHPLSGLEAPLWEMLLVMMEHEAHHRGQLSAYLKSRELEHPVSLWT